MKIGKIYLFNMQQTFLIFKAEKKKEKNLLTQFIYAFT